MSKRALQLMAPAKGDLVVGHRVYAIMPNGLPAVPGVIVAVCGATATMEIGEVLNMLGLPRRTVWTWRRSASAYQQKGAATVKGVGLCIDPRPKGRKP